MTLTLLLLHLASAATLLIWAVRMVRTGVERGYAGLLRRVVQQAERGRARSAFAGIATAVLLQGSTAVCLLATSFAQVGSISVATALAIILGADVGAALVVFLLSFDLSWLMPLLMLIGGWLFLRGHSRAVMQAGRILLGVALILLSLGLISEATRPVHDSAILASMIGYLEADPLTALILGAGVTWLIHSGVAAVLLFVTLASQGLLPLAAGLGLVLGGNVGSGLIAVGLTRHVPNEVRGIALGNLGFRAIAGCLATALLYLVELPVPGTASEVALWLVSLHLGFNLILMIIALPFTQSMSRLMSRFLPKKPDEAGGRRTYSTSALDESVVSDPVPALASATRELLRMGSMIDVMMRPVMALYENGAVESVQRIHELERDIDLAQTQVKLYLAKVRREELSESDAVRLLGLVSFAINLEHAGDIITHTLLTLAKKKRDNGLAFSADGWRELTRLHDRVMANMQLSMNVLVSKDKSLARQLIQEKERIRELEREGGEHHLNRLRDGTQKSIETSNIHLETLRALRQINSAFASVAYPILSEAGGLLDSRLADI